jgi:predicted nuclease of predicted toxin-antitoxin system
VRFLVDECVGPLVAAWLRAQSHETFSVFEESRGMSDYAILTKATAENWILVTSDKDFGDQVYRDRRAHRGIILLRLDDQRSDAKIAALQKLFAAYSDRLADRFVVVTESQVRFASHE